MLNDFEEIVHRERDGCKEGSGSIHQGMCIHEGAARAAAYLVLLDEVGEAVHQDAALVASKLGVLAAEEGLLRGGDGGVD